MTQHNLDASRIICMLFTAYIACTATSTGTPRLGQGIHLRHAEHIAYVYEIDILSTNGAVHILIGGQIVLMCNAWSNPIVLNTDQLCSLLFADIIQKFP